MGLEPVRTVLRLAVLLVLAASAVLLTAIGSPQPPDSCDPYVLEPDPETYCVTFTNGSGAPAGFFHVSSIVPSVSRWTPIDQPAGCADPEIWGGFEYRELVWPEPCVGPGESVTFQLHENTKLGGTYFAPSAPVVEAVNDTGRAASGLVFEQAGSFRGYRIVQNAPGCGAPSVDGYPHFELLWDSDCVDPGETVAVHFGDSRAVTSVPYVWLFPPLFGDASCDETIDAIDAALVLQYEASLLEALACAEQADANDDGSVDAQDALAILQFSAGLLPSLPP